MKAYSKTMANPNHQLSAGVAMGWILHTGSTSKPPTMQVCKKAAGDHPQMDSLSNTGSPAGFVFLGRKI